MFDSTFMGEAHMKLNSLCIECLMKRHFDKAARIEREEDRINYLLGAMKIIADSSGEPAPVLTAYCRELEDKYLGITQVYAEIKNRYNSLMLELEPKIAERIRQSADPLQTAMLFSRAGNYIDFGSQKPFDENKLYQILDRAEQETLDEAVYLRFRHDMENAQSLLFITDNCGEIVLDKLLLLELKRLYPNTNITVMVRGGPILNDATQQDAAQVGLTGHFTVVDNGTATPGTWLPSLSAERLELLHSADVIISKGQANIECLCGCGLNIYYMLLCKCSHFAKLFSVEQYTGMFINESEAGKLL